MEIKSENACFGGTQGVYAHASDSCGGEMTFGLVSARRGQARPGARAVVFVRSDLHP